MNTTYIAEKGVGGILDVKLVRCDFHKNKVDGPYFHVTYQVETLDKIEEIDIPKMFLPITSERLIIRGDRYGYGIFGNIDYTANLGFGDMRLVPDDLGVCYTRKTINEKTREMTLAEIEKKLGHKVKIVNK